MTLVRSILSMWVAFGVSLPLEAAAPIRLADQIPADSLLYLEIPSFSAFERLAREGCAARILAHPEIRQAFGVLLDQAKGSAEQYLAMGLAQIGIALEDVKRLLAGGLAIAVTGLEPFPGGLLMPQLYVSIDAKGTEEEVWATLERLVGAAKQAGASIELGPIEDGIRVIEWEGIFFFASRIGGSLVLSDLIEELEAMRGRVAAGAKAESPLAAAPGFQRAAKSIGDRPLLIAYANVAGIWAIASQFATAKAGPAVGIATLAGVPSIGSAALGLAWGKGEGIATAYLDFPDGRSGIFAIPGGEKLDPGILDRIPTNAFYACAGGWDPAGSFERLLALAASVPPLEELLEEKLPALEGSFGVKIRDSLATIGTQQASWQVFPAQGLLPTLGAAIRLKDPQGFRRAIEAVCKKTGGELREIGVAGRTVFVAEMPFLRTIEILAKSLDENAPSVDAMLEGVEGPEIARAIVANMTTQTAMCIDGETLLVAQTPYDLRSYLASRQGGAGGLSADPVFARTAEGRLAGQSGFVYLRVDPLLRAAYNTLVPIAQIVAGGALRRMAGVNLAALPTADFLQKELGGALVTYRVDPNAMELKANAMAGAVALGGAALLGGFTVPMFLAARGTARAQEVGCWSNLGSLGAAALMYAEDAGGELPSGAGAPALLLEKGYLADAAYLICPSSGRGPAEVEEEPCYLWTRAKVDRSDDPLTPIACDAMPWHGGKRNVLFLDGHVESVDEGTFIEQYAKFFEE